MKTIITNLRSRAGTSFLEVMVALAIMGVVTTAIFKLYITQHQNYMVQDDVSNVQQNARAVINELGRQIRMAGFDLPLGIDPIVAANTNPDTITITYSSTGCETYLASAMATAGSQLDCAVDVSCFDDGQWVYIFHPDSGGGEWFQISTVDAGGMKLQQAAGATLSKAFDKDAIVLSLSQVKFFLDTLSNPDNPSLCLGLPGQPPLMYAENIVDLQFRYRMKNGMLLDQPVVTDDIREVLISLTGRSENPDYEKKAAGVSDPYRYRTFNTTVFLRNVGI